MAMRVASARNLSTVSERAGRSRWLLLALLAAGAAPLFSSMARAPEVPALLPGRVATMAGSHISCKAFTYSVTCQKAKGLTATILSTGVVRVTRDSRRLTSTRRRGCSTTTTASTSSERRASECTPTSTLPVAHDELLTR